MRLRHPLRAAHPHWPDSYEKLPTRQFLEMTWTATGQSGGLLLTDPLDLTDRRLDLRTIVDPRSTDVDLRVRITDANGRLGAAHPGRRWHPAGARRLPRHREVLGADAVGRPRLRAAVDLTRITQVDLVSPSDSAASGSPTWPPRPRAGAGPRAGRRRSTSAESGSTRATGRRSRSAQVPFAIVGDVTRPARFVVVTTGQGRGHVERFSVDIAPGQTTGTIPVAYEADRRADYDAAGHPGRLPGHSQPDDRRLPRPRRDRRRRPETQGDGAAGRGAVDEGEPAVWRVRLSQSVDYDLSVRGKVVRVPAPT